jgi:UDP-MurNAc hydroxylase
MADLGAWTRPGIRVRYHYSACVCIETPDLRVLCDPWFTEGAYDGAWYHFPEQKDPLSAIGDVDYIYVSHIHPDHYDAQFIKSYMNAYGAKPVLIAAHKPNFLFGKMKADGVQATVLEAPRRVGNSVLEIVPHTTGGSSDIDSALIVRLETPGREHVVLNVNDIIFDQPMLERMQAKTPSIDILLCGYTGAGPFPQTYFDADDPELARMADWKKQEFFKRYRRLVEHLSPRATVPFAGKYVLGGALAPLNPHRGVADAAEVLAFDPKAAVPDDGGTIDTLDFEADPERRQPYPKEAMDRRIAEVATLPLDYERLMSAEEVHQLPLQRLLGRALERAIKSSTVDHDYFFAISLPGGKWALFNTNKSTAPAMSVVSHAELASVTPRSEVSIDPRYLFGLLTHVYHWNNAQVGSQYQTRRFPNKMDQAAENFLNFLAV